MKAKRNSIGQPFTRLGNLRTLLCVAALLALAAAPAARASDPVGIYGFVDRVVFEPSEAAPERIQVWGGFALAKPSVGNIEYLDAERGYMYFKLRPGNEEVCKKEWADLKSVAGTRQIVAFGARHEEPRPTLRKLHTKAENPDAHPKGMGVTKVTMRDGYLPLDQLKKLMDEVPVQKGEKAGN